MTDVERKAWDECVAQVRRHKDKCNYDEPKMESILAADAELKRLREADETAWALIDTMLPSLHGGDRDWAIRDLVRIERSRRAKG